jgi:hypothetical protein
MMKRNSVILTILLLTSFTILPTLATAEETRRDGNWWRKYDNLYKSAYIVGFFDGMDLGKNFSVWKIMEDEKNKNACAWNVLDSYDTYNLKYFKGVSNIQIVDGLNSFYDDYRNRSITIDSAVWIVVNSIAGTPKGSLESMIENHRRNAK